MLSTPDSASTASSIPLDARASRLPSRQNDAIGFPGGKARCDLEDGYGPSGVEDLEVVEEEEGDGSDHVLK